MRTATLLVLGLLASACAKPVPRADATAAPETEAAGVGTGRSGAMAGDLAEASAALAANAASLSALGVVVTPPGNTGRRDEDESREEARKASRDASKKKDRVVEDAKSTEPAPDLDVSTTTTPNRPAPSPITPPAPKPAAKPEPAPEPSVAADDGPVACGRICDLAGVACDLAQRICLLKNRHPGDARYEDVCWNAERQCEQASDACSDCSAC